MSYKLVPIKTEGKDRSMFDMGRIDPEKMYANIQKFNWRNINDGKIYLDEQTKKNSISLRNNLIRLSETFAQEGDTLKAVEVLNLSLDKMPIKDFGHFQFSLGYPEMYYMLGEKGKARETTEVLFKIIKEKLNWYASFPNDEMKWVEGEIETNLYMLGNVMRQVRRFENDSDFFKKLDTQFIDILKLLGIELPAEE
jgi:hypothetical protein